jgi:hypothetical protein
MAYQIVKNIPLPEYAGRGRGKGELRLAVEKMEVGDSFLVEAHKRSPLPKMAQVLDIGLTTRKEGDLYRVWRYK